MKKLLCTIAVSAVLLSLASASVFAGVTFKSLYVTTKYEGASLCNQGVVTGCSAYGTASQRVSIGLQKGNSVRAANNATVYRNSNATIKSGVIEKSAGYNTANLALYWR